MTATHPVQAIEDTKPTTLARRLWVVALGCVGAALWFWVYAANKGSLPSRLMVAIKNSLSLRQVVPFLCTIALVCVPKVRRAIEPVFSKLSAPTPISRRMTTIILVILATVYLFLTAHFHHRDLFPKWNDEFAYLLQARHMASGHLWMPGHPLGEFFESFYLFIQPKYATQYSPGAALLFVPGIWLSLGKWVIPLFLSGACVGLTYRVFAELIDGVAGIVGAAFLLGLRVFRFQSLMAMAFIPILFFTLLLTYAWLKWRAGGKGRYLALMGIAAGWAAVTRPVDGVAIVAPFALMFLLDLKARHSGKMLRPIAIVLAGFFPFIALHAVLNRGLTGHWLKIPIAYYSEKYYPQLTLGFPKFDPTLKAQTNILQKQLMNDEWIVGYVKTHQPENWMRDCVNYRLPESFRTVAPLGIVLILFPIGLLALTDRRRWLVFWPFVAAVIIYNVYTVFMPQYVFMGLVGAGLMIVLGAAETAKAFPLAGVTRMAIPLLLLVATALSLPEVTQWIRDDRGHEMPILERCLELPKLVKAPAVVLFKFSAGQGYHEEPVYNIDTASIDDAPIIRAHDLGDEANQRLFKYYAQIQPDRMIYRIDRADPTLTPVRLGTAKDLADRR